MNDYAPALDVALAAARDAAAVHRRHLGQVIGDDWAEKGVADFVTHVDREAEACIVAQIRDRFPDHLILAEESAADDTKVDGEWLWVVDPLDGTTNFLHQYPVYCASIALLHKGEPVVGVVVSAIGEEFTAVLGGGAFLNGRRLRVSETSLLERCLIGTGFPFKLPHAMDDYLRQFKDVSARVSDIRRAGAAALDLCHVAAGYFDGFWEVDLRPWDYAAGVLMVREAGGLVGGLANHGRRAAPIDWHHGGGIIAGNPHVYPLLCDIVIQEPA